jgi:hypothetical protein
VILSALSLALLPGRDAAAVVSDWNIDHVPVYVGDQVTFTDVDDGQDAVSSVLWEYSCLNSGCDNSYVPIADGSPVTGWQFGCGTLNVRMTVTYAQNYFGPTPKPTVVIHSVVILPPDGTRLEPGSDAVTPVDQASIVYLQLQGGGTDIYNIADYVVGVQQRITQLSWDPEYDSGWIPAQPDPPNFYCDNLSRIVDLYIIRSTSAEFQQSGDGLNFATRKQQLRVLMTGCCSDVVIGSCGTYYPVFHRVDATDYQVLY